MSCVVDARLGCNHINALYKFTITYLDVDVDIAE